VSTKEDLRPLQPTRGRSIQGVKGKLDRALTRPQCLVFGLPPYRPKDDDVINATWDDRGYSWNYRGAPIEDGLTISTRTAHPRQPFSKISIALDLFPIYANAYYESAEPFQDTYDMGAVGDYAISVRLRQGVTLIGSLEGEGECQYCPLNPLSESHLLRTLSWQHFTAATKVYGTELAYKEGTYDRIRDQKNTYLKIRPEVDIDQDLYIPTMPMEIEIIITGSASIAWKNGNIANLPSNIFSPDIPAYNICNMWATSFSAWGHSE